MISLYLSLGSNLGDREANIREALRLLDESFGVGYESLSDLIETEPWGFEADRFINCVVLYKLPRTRQSKEDQALDVLKTVKWVERRLGRDEVLEFAPDGSRVYHSRPIDIDILFFGPHRIFIDILPDRPAAVSRSGDAGSHPAAAGPRSAAAVAGSRSGDAGSRPAATCSAADGSRPTAAVAGSHPGDAGLRPVAAGSVSAGPCSGDVLPAVTGSCPAAYGPRPAATCSAADGSRPAAAVAGSCPVAAGSVSDGSRSAAVPVLQIPHPLIAERDFVMIPLAQIAKNTLKREFPSIFKN